MGCEHLATSGRRTRLSRVREPTLMDSWITHRTEPKNCHRARLGAHVARGSSQVFWASEVAASLHYTQRVTMTYLTTCHSRQCSTDPLLSSPACRKVRASGSRWRPINGGRAAASAPVAKDVFRIIAGKQKLRRYAPRDRNVEPFTTESCLQDIIDVVCADGQDRRL